ncbi:MAG: hypothetical protein P4M11_03880 [Candidatus Pacebacteria bacterium]|nr:hypothetical protein [Candidatus Paceibacterota bacterium]
MSWLFGKKKEENKEKKKANPEKAMQMVTMSIDNVSKRLEVLETKAKGLVHEALK